MSACLLVAEMRVRDVEKLVRYGREVVPVMARHGGRILGTSASGLHVAEGEERPVLMVVHEWESRAAFDAFWASPEYQALKALRREACDTWIATFDATAPPA